jgi:hypothetical protein
MGVAISSSEELEAWLKDKPLQWAQVVAFRSALRVLPLAFSSQMFRSGGDEAVRAMALFRAMAVVSGRFSAPRIVRSSIAPRSALNGRARRAALAASGAFSALTAALSEEASRRFEVTHAYAVRAVVGAAAADVARGSEAVSSAAAAAASATAAAASSRVTATGSDADRETARATVWQSITDDCDQLMRKNAIESVLDSPLWPVRPPRWVDQKWALASSWLNESRDGFALWADWYARRLSGKQFAFEGFDEGADREFFTRLFAQDNLWWVDKRVDVNAEIAGWVKELSKRKEINVSALDSPLSDATSPPLQDTISPEQVREILQEIASPQAVVANGQISFRANAEFETPNGELEAWHPRHLLDIIDVLRLGLRDNAPNPLKVGLAKYYEVLARDPDLPVITTLQTCIGVVRTTFQSDGHEIWAEGLEVPFDALFHGHKRLLSDYPNLQERRRLRDQITPTPAARKIDGLNADIARFADIAAQLEELGVTDETAHAYLQSIVDIGRQIALGSGTDAPGPDDADDWTPPAQIRADMSGVMARIESQVSLLLSITGHPNFQAALVAIAPEVGRLLTFFG